MLTVEGLRRAFLFGEVAVSCGLATPPRAGLKLLATLERVTMDDFSEFAIAAFGSRITGEDASMSGACGSACVGAQWARLARAGGVVAPCIRGAHLRRGDVGGGKMLHLRECENTGRH